MYRPTLRRLAARLLTAAAFVAPVALPAPALAQAPAPANAPADSPRKMSSKELYEHAVKGTGWVVIKEANGLRFGTGWVLDRDKRLLITNEHVIEGRDEAGVYFPIRQDGELVHEPDHYLQKVEPIKAKVIDRDSERDLALLRLDSIPEGVQALKLAAGSPSVGEELFTVGAWSQGNEALWGGVDGKVRVVANTPLRGSRPVKTVKSSMPTNGGNSGGAILNDRGEVVAVHQGYRTDAREVTLHIDVSELKAYLKEALPLVEPKTAAEFQTRGDRQLRQWRLDRAAADFSEAIKLDRNLAGAYVGRGNVFLRKGDAQTALADFGDALRVEPASKDALTGRGIAYRKLGKFDESLADLSNAIRNHPDDMNGYNERGITAFVAKKYEEAIGDYTRAIRLRDNEPVLYGNRADCHEALKRYDDAAADLKEAVRLAPYSAWYHNRLGLVYYRGGSYRPAAECFQSAARCDGRNPLYPSNLGDALRMAGQYDEAVTAFSEALKLAPNAAGGFDLSYVHFGRGAAYRGLKDYPAAVKDLNKAIQMNDRNAAYFYERGLAHQGAGSAEAAAEDFKKAAKLNPDRYGAAVKQVNPLLGTWRYSGTINGVPTTVRITFNEDGTFAGTVRSRDASGNVREVQDSGTWKLSGNTLTVEGKTGKVVRKISRDGKKVSVVYDELGMTLVYELVD